jgi:hypothetical protein
MASNPRNWAEEQDEVEEQYQPKPGHRLPGWTVDALLEQGQEEEAGAELERLLQEGIDSGHGFEATPEYFDSLRAGIAARSRER